MYNAYAVGQRVYLRHPTAADVEGRWHEWLSDEHTMMWAESLYWPNSIERQRKFYESIQGAADRLVLSIVDKADDRHIGICNLSSINWVHRFCDVAIIIGEPDFRQGPHALDAFAALIRIAFLRLNMQIVRSVYMARNEASKRMHDVLRFQTVGRIPNLYTVQGKATDSVIAILRQDEWMARNGVTTAANTEGAA